MENETVDTLFEQIEETISKLEQDDISLEDSFAEYQKGMALLKSCNEKIDTIEKQVLKITGDGELAVFEGLQEA